MQPLTGSRHFRDENDNGSESGGRTVNLVAENDPILKEKTPVFDFATPPVDPVAFSDELHAAMASFKHAAGLAAPQVGFLHRVFVMNIDRPVTCFNPEIVAVSPEFERGDEGCLSFPDLWLKIKRPLWVDAKFHDASGNLVYERFDNLAARCYLHETDHLDGVRFTDLASPLALKMAKDKRSKRR
jgi:peptide deformylase